MQTKRFKKAKEDPYQQKLTKEWKARKRFERPYEKARYRRAAGAIIYHLDKVPYYLLVKYPSYWGFVKGYIEEGETEHHTILREAGEESGLYDLKFIEGFREVQKYFHRFKGELIKSVVVYLLAQTESWTVKISHEHEDYRWCTFADAMELMRVNATKELLKKAHNFLQGYRKSGFFNFLKIFQSK